MTEAQRQIGGPAALVYVGDAMLALKGADAVVIATEWKELRSPDFNRMARLHRCKAVFDCCNMFEAALPKSAGLE